MSKPTGKLAFVYRTISRLDAALADLRAENKQLRDELAKWEQCHKDIHEPALRDAHAYISELHAELATLKAVPDGVGGNSHGPDALRQPVADEQEAFCEGHCTWLDHHPGCVRAALSASAGKLAAISEQEPVGYFVQPYTDRPEVIERVDDSCAGEEDVFPLYRRPLAAQQDAIVADEREAFERWAWEAYEEKYWWDIQRQAVFAVNIDGEYRNPLLNNAWPAWQARAALSAPAAGPDALSLLNRALPYLSNTPDLVQHGAEELAVEIRALIAANTATPDVSGHIPRPPYTSLTPWAEVARPMVEALEEVRRRVPMPDWARAKIDAALAAHKAGGEA